MSDSVRDWMERTSARSERIGGLLQRASINWALGQHGPAKLTLNEVLRLLHEEETDPPPGSTKR